MRLVVDAQLIVEDVGITAGFADPGVARQIEMFREAIAGVPRPHSRGRVRRRPAGRTPSRRPG